MKMAYKAKNLIARATKKSVRDACLVVEAGKIDSIQKNVPKGVPELDLGDVTLLPGLIDAHLHFMWTGESADPDYTRRSENTEMGMLRMADHARKSIAGGITTCRDTGSPTDMIMALRKAIEMGLVPGPRVVSAGTLISMTGGHVNTISKEVDGPDEVRKAARSLIKSGADFLKLVASGGIYGHGEEIGSLQLDVDELSAAVREAHKAGKKVAAHVYPAKGIENCLDAGIDTIEHGSFLTHKLAKRMAAQGAYLVPTLSIFQAMHSRQNDPATLDFIRRKTLQVIKASQEAVKIAKANGVKIGAGTDSGGPWHPHGSVIKEIEALVNVGLSASEALEAATMTNAEILGLEAQIGSIETGKIADFIAVHGDPIKDISAINKIAVVVKGGIPIFAQANYAEAIASLRNAAHFFILPSKD
jgi:imidazolonepropionase-like amidohydrolase